jgi:hypothetical protein
MLMWVWAYCCAVRVRLARTGVAEQTRDPRNETILLGVVIEPVPEDQLRLFRREGMGAVAGFAGDEIDGVVAVPVLEAVTPVEELVACCGTRAEAGLGRFSDP